MRVMDRGSSTPGSLLYATLNRLVISASTPLLTGVFPAHRCLVLSPHPSAVATSYCKSRRNICLHKELMGNSSTAKTSHLGQNRDH